MNWMTLNFLKGYRFSPARMYQVWTSAKFLQLWPWEVMNYWKGLSSIHELVMPQTLFHKIITLLWRGWQKLYSHIMHLSVGFVEPQALSSNNQSLVTGLVEIAFLDYTSVHWLYEALASWWEDVVYLTAAFRKKWVSRCFSFEHSRNMIKGDLPPMMT